MHVIRSYYGNLMSALTLSTCQHLSYTEEITYNVKAQGGKNVKLGTTHGNPGVRR